MKNVLFTMFAVVCVICATGASISADQRSPSVASEKYIGSEELSEALATDGMILAEGVDGILGWIYATELSGSVPRSPEDALSLQKNVKPSFV